MRPSFWLTWVVALRGVPTKGWSTWRWGWSNGSSKGRLRLRSSSVLAMVHPEPAASPPTVKRSETVELQQHERKHDDGTKHGDAGGKQEREEESEERGDRRGWSRGAWEAWVGWGWS